MKATGIVRRIDDLGRVVIPKEIRRQMGIREGDPLEIFTENDAICLKKYHPYGEKDWGQATSVAKVMLDHKFAILNRYNEVKGDNCGHDMSFIDSMDYSQRIMVDGDIIGFIKARRDEVNYDKIAEVAKVISVMFAEEG